jgi:C-terminal processing protease CtpA/Prc
MMPVHANQKSQRHWSKNVRDVSLVHEGLQLRIDGGAENGEFLYVGALPTEKSRYRKGRFRVGDILIELNEESVVGLTLQDLMNRINKAGKKVNFKVVQPGRVCCVFVHILLHIV